LPTFAAGLDAVREIVQNGLRPAGCRLVEPREVALTLAGDGSAALLLLVFEGETESLDRALGICARHGGRAGEGGSGE
ncbi:FAD-linked oxidase C-terminal domain-containing protein, partial [Klebsiella pneumoniae]|uniref:FAD-linked oxidase C-terminal domain-containing protein n=1 Tax=Klebsiella pneumoniae TaxID=573 RepID=UPI0030136FC4